MADRWTYQEREMFLGMFFRDDLRMSCKDVCYALNAGDQAKAELASLRAEIAELQAENAKLRELANPIGDSSEKQQAQAWVYVWRTLEKLGVHGFLGGTNAMTKAAEFINAIFAENAKLRGDVAMLRTTVKCLHDLAKERARNTTADYAANDAARKDGAK